MDFSSLIVVGALVSLLVQILKQYTLGSWRSQLILILVSLLGGAAYYFFKEHQHYWLIVLQVLATADIIYQFIIKYFEPKPLV